MSNVKICTCGKPLYMIKTSSGAYMPAEADEELTIIDDQGMTRKGWRVHWGRCPDEKDHRGKKPVKGPPQPAICVCGHRQDVHLRPGPSGGCNACSCPAFVQISGDPEGGGHGKR